MSDIKFRAWDKKIDNFHYWDSVSQKHNNIFWEMAKNEKMPINQHLFKINSIDIYQDDILECSSGDVTYISRVTGRGIVEVINSDYDNTMLDWALENGDIETVKVLGNMSQNETLLKP